MHAPADLQPLQRFFEENPEYQLLVEGEPPGGDAAQKQFDALPPPDWPLKKKWTIGFHDAKGRLIAIADLLEDLFIAGVWHLGLFIVSTRLHGRGTARPLYDALEQWVHGRGATWLRLGVVTGNARAARFWEKCGYHEVRLRLGVPYGKNLNDIRVMVKPLSGGSMADYLAAVARDRPE
jgi:GNAT superfamily N-acetyltransferase